MELSDIEKKILVSQEALLQEQMDERFKKLENNVLHDVAATKVTCIDMAAEEHHISFKLNGQLIAIPITITHWEELSLRHNVESIAKRIAEKLVQEIFYKLMNE